MDNPILKIIPIISLVAFVALHCGTKWSRYPIGIVIGLILSAIGDSCLVYIRDPSYFVKGIIAFLCAQLVYTVTFGFRRFKPYILICCIIVGSSIYFYIFPQLKTETVYLIAIYDVLLFLMTWRALSRVHLEKPGSILCGLGAISFIISDLTLGLVITEHIPPNEFIIMATYYAAQFGIAMSVIDLYTDEESEWVDLENPSFKMKRP
ncbi:lysoplasmalogenase TMEM86A-like [Saccoglossus kowalevskii]|uniref:lysoplasmalogenase n=1 Tax=Saccoglossus kowalevskii TaxID=10224 RepID=A0ABM0LVM2_SACKO|nr:PREDICTED: lysoplasmalogenase-like protein TMEM86A-like [Saccoglossus kowalevskii]